jgi:obscurin-RhoGEF protein
MTNCTLNVTDQYAKCPKFLTKPKTATVQELGRAHFECKLMTSDGVVVQWYKDGEVLQDGTRFVLLNDFGYVALDILKCVKSDRGMYTCVASNMYGSDRVDVELRIGDEGVIEGSGQCPAFTSCLRNIRIKETEKAHFEAKLIPVSDESMVITWYKDGAVLKEGEGVHKLKYDSKTNLART